MPIQPQDFFLIAEQLHYSLKISADGEPCIRTVAGRAYYSVYLALREAARTAVRDPSFNIGHQALASHLDDYEGDLEAVAVQLRELRYFREIAVYWPAETLDRHSVGLALNNAKAIVRDQSTLSRQLDAGLLKLLHQGQDFPKR